MLPLPIIPSPPALLTALANRQPLAQTIPACINGNSILKSRVILFVTTLIDLFYNKENLEFFEEPD
jgi:hypothetical protein